MVSTHLWYNCNRETRIVAFQCELIAHVGKDPICTYYMACGFSGGYLGMQVNSLEERRILFSVWDDGEGHDVEKIEGGKDVIVQPFGGEGEGLQSIFKHNWKTGQPQRFMVTAKPEPETKTTVYSGYFWMDDAWKLLSSLRRPGDGQYLRGLYSFLENWSDDQADLRECWYGKQFMKLEGRDDWIELTEVKCTNTTPDDSKCEHFGFCMENRGFCMRIDGNHPLGVQVPSDRKMCRECCGTCPVD